MLPTARWYECDGCGQPQLKLRIAPKQVADRKVKCIMSFQCKGRMSGPIENPTGEPGLDEANFVPERKVKAK